MNSVEVYDHEISDLKPSCVPFEQQYFLLLKNKGLPMSGVCLLSPVRGMVYYHERVTGCAKTVISCNENDNN